MSEILSSITASSLSESELQRLRELLGKYEDVISKHDYDLGHMKDVEHDIDTGDVKPFKFQPYRLSFEERKILKNIVDEMKTHNLVRDSNSPYASPTFLVKKPDGSHRLVCDWRHLNSFTKKDSMPLPRIDDTLDRLAGAKYFSKIDCTSGFWQVGISKRAIEKTAFVTPDGLYEFLRMGMGLCNVPATFQRAINHALGNLLWKNCMVYLDDILVFSKSFSEHLSDIEEVLQKLRESNIKIKPSKCVWAAPSVKYLGHVVSLHGIAADPDKTRAILEFPIPKDKTQLKSFLGLASYYRRFIKDFSSVAKCLFELTSPTNSTFNFQDKHLQAMNQLKLHLTSSGVMAHPDFTRKFIVATDASNVGLGAVLKQLGDDGKERVICWASRTLNPSEINYATNKKELLAVMFGITFFRPYLYGRKFEIITDHHSLCYLFRNSNKTGILARWALTLSEYEFEVKYKSDRKHQDADALFRGAICFAIAPEHEVINHISSKMEKPYFNFQVNQSGLTDIARISPTKVFDSDLGTDLTSADLKQISKEIFDPDSNVGTDQNSPELCSEEIPDKPL